MAVRLSTSAIAALVALEKSVQSQVSPRFRWSPPESAHLTLAFLGEVAEADTHSLEVRLSEIEASGFSLHLTEVGAFPSLRHCRILWVGLGGDGQALRDLQQMVVAACDGFGDAAREHRFAPHVTVARLPNGALPEDLTPLGRVSLPPSPWHVTKFELVRSVLGPSGSRYETLRCFSLHA